MGITVEYHRDAEDADVDVPLYEELFAGTAVPVPDLSGPAAGRPAATVVARHTDGRLLGWAEVWEEDDGTGVPPFVQWLLVDRERERITTGRHTGRPGTDEELETAVRLLRRAATGAAAAGRTALEWNGAGDGLDERVAAELGAEESEELGRRWGTPLPPAGPQPPAGPPEVTVRTVPAGPGADLLAEHARFYTAVTGQPYDPEDAAELLADLPPVPHVTLDLLAPDGTVAAQATATALDDEAFVDVIFRTPGTGAGALTAFVTELLARVRRELPAVTRLTVQEHDDPVTAEALTAAGLRVTDRWCRYRMGL
ncbi:hypothetical protein [Streptomyces caatingaensis]|uniref:Uncharacterized protein n=1 Tax=Streptomyces caatingaensis TaxID=1678637 RepID=A0A0K9XBM7_9ACTN|nr:hypothetical protein [Streptomyces caatingaensis]KNB50613.1 hypothetical protein AC230_22040 [Streptomyces caatingaensis]